MRTAKYLLSCDHGVFLILRHSFFCRDFFSYQPDSLHSAPGCFLSSVAFLISTVGLHCRNIHQLSGTAPTQYAIDKRPVFNCIFCLIYLHYTGDHPSPKSQEGIAILYVGVPAVFRSQYFPGSEIRRFPIDYLFARLPADRNSEHLLFLGDISE